MEDVRLVTGRVRGVVPVEGAVLAHLRGVLQALAVVERGGALGRVRFEKHIDCSDS